MAHHTYFVAVLLAALVLGVIASIYADAGVRLASLQSSPGPFNPNEPGEAQRPHRL
jgi:hypothetical protein